MSDEAITLEQRFEALERRFAILEECTERLLSLVVRVAERQGVQA